MKKSFVMLATLVLSGTTAFAAQGSEPKNLNCVVEELADYQTRIQEVISTKTIIPKLNANRSGMDEMVLIKRGKIRISLELSYLDYTPLVSTHVKVGDVKIETGLRASVTDPKTGNQIVVNCSYDKSEE